MSKSMVNRDFWYLKDYFCGNKTSGVTGQQGPLGLTGRRGPQGPQGFRGEKGEPGNDVYDNMESLQTSLFCKSVDTPKLPQNITYDFEHELFVGDLGIWELSEDFSFEVDDEAVWMCYAYIQYIGDGLDNDRLVSFSGPYRVTGNEGQPGESVRFIYQQTNRLIEDIPVPEYVDEDDFYNRILDEEGWTLTPQGLIDGDTEYRYEVFTSQTKRSDGTWSLFGNISYFSMVGVKGDDGNGIEYIYTLRKNRVAPSLPEGYENSPNYQNPNFVPDEKWHDDPKEVTKTMPYQYYSTRKYADGSWGLFSAPKLWNEYLEDGVDGISLKYCGTFNNLEDFQPYLDNKDIEVIDGNVLEVGEYYVVEGSIYVFVGKGEGFRKYNLIDGDTASQKLYIIYASKIGTSETNYGFEIVDADDVNARFIGTLCTSNEADSEKYWKYNWRYFKGEDGFGIEYIFTRTKTDKAPKVPTASHETNEMEFYGLNWHGMDENGVVWTDDPLGVDNKTQFEWYCKRYNLGEFKGNVDGYAKLFTNYQYADGSIGKNGLILYPAGVWVESETYKRSEYATPYVMYFYDNEYKYYYFKNNGKAGEGNSKNSPYESFTKDEGIWEEIERKDGIFTDILLADNALFGQCVFNGDWIFSQTGIDKDGFVCYEYENFYPVDPYYLNNTYDEYKESGADVPDKIFKPSVAFNFKTGEVYACDGNVRITGKDSLVISDNKGNKLLYFDEYGNLNIISDFPTPIFDIDTHGDFFKYFIPAPLVANEDDWNTYMYNTTNGYLASEVASIPKFDVDGVTVTNPYYSEGDSDSVYPTGVESVSVLNSSLDTINDCVMILDGEEVERDEYIKYICMSVDVIYADTVININTNIGKSNPYYSVTNNKDYQLALFLPVMTYEHQTLDFDTKNEPDVIRTATMVGGELHYVTVDEIACSVNRKITLRNNSGADIIIINNIDSGGGLYGHTLKSGSEVCFKFTAKQHRVIMGDTKLVPYNLKWELVYERNLFTNKSNEFGLDFKIVNEYKGELYGYVDETKTVHLTKDSDNVVLKYIDGKDVPLTDFSDF